MTPTSEERSRFYVEVKATGPRGMSNSPTYNEIGTAKTYSTATNYLYVYARSATEIRNMFTEYELLVVDITD